MNATAQDRSARIIVPAVSLVVIGVKVIHSAMDAAIAHDEINAEPDINLIASSIHAVKETMIGIRQTLEEMSSNRMLMVKLSWYYKAHESVQIPLTTLAEVIEKCRPAALRHELAQSEEYAFAQEVFRMLESDANHFYEFVKKTLGHDEAAHLTHHSQFG